MSNCAPCESEFLLKKQKNKKNNKKTKQTTIVLGMYQPSAGLNKYNAVCILDMSFTMLNTHHLHSSHIIPSLDMSSEGLLLRSGLLFGSLGVVP